MSAYQANIIEAARLMSEKVARNPLKYPNGADFEQLAVTAAQDLHEHNAECAAISPTSPPIPITAEAIANFGLGLLRVDAWRSQWFNLAGLRRLPS